MNRLAIVALPLLLLFLQNVTGQTESTSTVVISGRVIDDSMGFVLPFAHIWNESRRQGGFSNDAGEFSMIINGQDTLVFNSLGYMSKVVVVSASSVGKEVLIRLKPKYYELDEVVVRRFRSYESFKYQVLNHELPKTGTEQAKEFIQLTAVSVAIEADRERAVKDKIETGRFGYTTPLGKGIDQEKAFKKKIAAQKEREKIISAKFNRALVGDITHLGGDELTEFIAFCNFSEKYLYETDLYAIVEDLYAKFENYQISLDTIPSENER